MTSSRMLCAGLLGSLVIGSVVARAQTPPAPTPPTEQQVREIEQRLDALSKQVDQLGTAKDAATRQGLMQQNWRAMQDYMGWMHGRWGAGSPWMMGPGMMGCPMLGGSGAGWTFPEGVTPEQYRQQMSEHMKRMHEQMRQLT